MSLVASLAPSAGLFLVNLDHIVLLHLQRLRVGLQAKCATNSSHLWHVEGVREFDPFRRKEIHLWRFVIVDPAAVKQESEGGDGDAHSLTVGLLQLAHLGGLLHPEVDLVAILS